MPDNVTDPAEERDDRPDADAEEAASTIVLRTAEGDLVHAGKYANIDASEAGARQLPDEEVIATGPDQPAPPAKTP